MLRFADGGGRSYTSVGTSNVNLISYWSNYTGNLAPSVLAANGRVTGSCLRIIMNNGANTGILTKNLDAQGIWGIAFAFRTTGGPPGNTIRLVSFQDNGTDQCELRFSADSSLTVTRNGTTLGVTGPVVTTNCYIHVEFKITIHPSAGTVDLWVNGVSKLSLTSQNTRSTTNSTANTVLFGVCNAPSGPVTNYDFDDIIIYDGQTSDANGNPDITGPIGDCGVTVLAPSGAGTTTQFTPDSGSNYARLTEATPDTTSYVESSTVGNKDTYAMGDLPANISAVKSIATLHYAIKTDVGSRQIGSVVRSGGTNYTHPTGIDLGNSYLYYFRNWGSNPNTATSWTPTTVNALEAGQVVNS